MDCKLIIALWALFFTPLLAADIYVSEEAGSPSYSDIPVANAEKLVLSVSPYRYQVTVKRVIDGDTIELDSGEKVRLVGVNTPEIGSRFHQEQPGGEQAKVWLEKYLQGHVLYLEYDEEQYDKYERLLAHAYLDNADYVNAALLREGLAVLTLTPPNLRYSDFLIQAQAEAEKQRLGVWQLAEYQLQPQSALTTDQYAGLWQRWRVKINSIQFARKYVRLVISEDVYISIAKKDLDLFPDLNQYKDKMIEVRGWLSHRNNEKSILVKHPSALLVSE